LFAAAVANVGRALPSIVLIAFGLTILGVGFWNNTAALVVLAIPPILTNAYFGIEGVDRDAVEAARGMGLTERQVLLQVELPLGLPFVLAGIRIAAIFVIATATIAAVAGGKGLGEIIVNQASYGLAGVVAASLCVSALAFLAALLLSLLRRALSPT
jgi:osmoprotectant transport system permease protein